MSQTAPTAPDRSHLQAYAFLVATALCWAGNAILGKIAVDDISPMLLVLGRWTGVIILCIVFLGPTVAKDWPVLKSRLPFLFSCGALGFTAFNALFYAAAHTTSALNIGIMQGSIPIFVLIGAFIVYRQRIRPMQALGVALTVIGVTVVASKGSLDRLIGLDFALGDMLMILACCLYAGYAVALFKRPNVNPLSMFTVMSAAALITSLPLAGFETATGTLLWPTPTGWLVLALVTVFPSFIAQIFFIHGVDRIGPGRAGVFMNLVPVFAAVLAVFVLSETFETHHAVALTLVLLGIWLSEKFKAR